MRVSTFLARREKFAKQNNPGYAGILACLLLEGTSCKREIQIAKPSVKNNCALTTQLRRNTRTMRLKSLRPNSPLSISAVR